jgi:hypothetical protein
MMDRTGSRTCPHCQGQELFTTSVPSGSVEGPQFLPGLGSFLAYAEFDVVVCAGCGHTQLFVPLEARRKLADSGYWRRLSAASAEEPGRPAEAEDTCLRCGKPMPENASTCEACGWSYESPEAV